MKIVFALLSGLLAITASAQNNPLLDAAFWKNNPDLPAVKAAVEKGNSPSEFNRMSFDPVVLAINNRASADVIKYLLSFQENSPAKLTHDGRTYIFWAASSGNAEIVQYLLEKGARLDVEDSHGATPLTFAAGAAQKNTAIYELFAKYGADLKKALNQEGASLLLLAIPQDKDLVLTNYFISKGLDLKATDRSGNTAFNYAARGGNLALLRTLVEKGVKYNDKALLMASQAGRAGAGNSIAVFEYLDSLRLKPTATNANGETPLHLLARQANQLPTINFLVSKGANVNATDLDGNTPFMNAAAVNRDTATIAFLASRAKNINQVNKKGLSALAMAVNSNSAAVVRYLIQNGADLNVRNADGENLAYYLVQSYNAARGAEDFDAKMLLLKESGFDLTALQQNGNTLYHLAIAKNDLGLLKRLEPLKIDVNARNKEGLTVLHKAAMTAKDDAILKYLLSIGARKDLTTDFKETAFDLASENEYLSKNKVTIDFLK